MAEHIAKSYSCDRCGIGIGAPSKTMHVRVERLGEWATEIDIRWNDFCEQCDREVTEFFRKKVSRP